MTANKYEASAIRCVSQHDRLETKMVLHIWNENWRQLVNISVLDGQFSYESILFSIYNLFMWINPVCCMETTITDFFSFNHFSLSTKYHLWLRPWVLWLFPFFLICFGCECQLNAWKVKIQKLCSRHIHLGPNKQMSRSSQKNKAFFLSCLPNFCSVLSTSKSPGHCSAAYCISSHV